MGRECCSPGGSSRSRGKEQEPSESHDDQHSYAGLEASCRKSSPTSISTQAFNTTNSIESSTSQDIFIDALEQQGQRASDSSSQTFGQNSIQAPCAEGSSTCCEQSTPEDISGRHLHNPHEDTGQLLDCCDNSDPPGIGHHHCGSLQGYTENSSNCCNHSHTHETDPHPSSTHGGKIRPHLPGMASSRPASQSDRWLKVPKRYKRGSSRAGKYSTYERIILTIKGLKCGCCENGLSTAVANIPAIKNHRVNVVLARVEFDLDTSQMPVAHVIKRLHGATGYTFEEYAQPESQTLELLVSDPAEILQAGKPYGVTLIDDGEKHLWSPSRLLSGRSSVVPTEIMSEKATTETVAPKKPKVSSLYQYVVRVHYDATRMGARDVFEYYRLLAPNQHLQLASPSTHPSLAVGARQTKRACAVFLFSLLFTIPVLVFAWVPRLSQKIVYAHASLACASVVQILATKEFVPVALRSLFHSRLLEMDFLVALSTTTAYVFSVVSYVLELHDRPLETGSFFETATLLATLIFLGRVVSEFARFRAAKSVSFRSLQIEDALLVSKKSSELHKQRTAIHGSLHEPAMMAARWMSEPETRNIDARLLQYGDYFKVAPHSRIVTDGKVVYGGSEVDESMITGESIPVAKGLDQNVYAGTLNGSGTLIIRLTALPHENSISKIATMVENAELTKPKAQALADRIAGWFVYVIATITTIVFLIWLFVDRFYHDRKWGNAVIKALTYAIATLVVSCPCAIGLAVPMVVLIAGGVSARFGIIFRDPQKLEVARNVTDMVFDKTGTLTTGLLEVVEAQFHHPATDVSQATGVLLALLKDVRHPVAVAVFKFLDKTVRNDVDNVVIPAEVVNITSVPGQGIQGIDKKTGLEVRAGNPQWLGVEVLETTHTLLCVMIGNVFCATFRLKDNPRYTARPVINELHGRDIGVHMISGDSAGAVNEIAHSLGIARVLTKSRFTPEDKFNYIKELQDKGRVIMFLGDGTNDSVALKQADVGVHMSHGSDVARSAADVVLMTIRLHDILILLDISKAAYRRIILNFTWSAVYNVIAVLLAAGAFVKTRIEPRFAGLGELVSVLPVVFFAFTLKWMDYGKKYRAMEYDFSKE